MDLGSISIIVGFLAVFASVVVAWADMRARVRYSEISCENGVVFRKECSSRQDARFENIRGALGRIELALTGISHDLAAHLKQHDQQHKDGDNNGS